MTKTPPTKGAPVKKTKKAELPLPDIAFGCVPTFGDEKTYRNQDDTVFPPDAFVPLEPTLWLVQKGRKRASFTNEKAARAFAGKTGKIRAFVEVQA